MYCKNCGRELNYGSNFCSNCGTKVGEGIEYCGSCGVKSIGEAYCSNCGQEMNSFKEAKKDENNNYNNQSPNSCKANNVYNGKPKKSKVAAGILGILLGGIGVHRFYLGYVGIGILQVLVTIITLGMGSLWGFIEGILILCGSTITTDADGNPLSDN